MNRQDFLLSTVTSLLTVRHSQEQETQRSPLPEVDTAMAQFLEEQKIPGGSVAILLNGRLVYTKGYGFADIEQQRLFLPTTSARIGSVSKPITALATLKLVALGKLSLDEPAFPKIGLEPFLRAGEQVDGRLWKTSVRHLLQHTTGYDEKRQGNFTVDVSTVGRLMGKPLPVPADIVRFYMGKPRVDEPGIRYAYDNAGYLALGRLIAKVSGQEYEAYVRANILEPLGITRMRVGTRLCKDSPSWETTPYGADGPQQTTPGEYWESCGGWAASSVDLAKVVRSLTTNRITRILPRNLVNEITRKPDYVPEGANNYYGLGWTLNFQQNATGTKMIFNHSGSGGVGMAFVSSRWDGAAVCMVFNRDKVSSLQKIWDSIGRALDNVGVGRYPQRDLFAQYPE